MWERFWRQVRRAVTAGAVVLSFLLLMELLRAYQTLDDLHPWAGYAFLIALAAGVVWVIGRLLGGWRYRPRTLTPPDIEDLDTAGKRDLRRYGRYLRKFLRRLAINEALSDEQRQAAAAAAERLPEALGDCRTPEATRAALRAAEAEGVLPPLAVLDAEAEEEIGTSVRDVMVAVAASPWPLIDAAIVLYRTGGMVARITHIYNSRPSIREQLTIFADVARLVATIKLAHMMRKLLERTVRDVPLAGRVAEALTQAVGAGVLTSAAGHAAKHRCRAFRGWDRQEAARHLRARLGDFLNDCWRVASETLMGPLGALYHRSMDGLGSAFKRAVDATREVADTFVRKPVLAGGLHMGRGVRQSARWIFRRRRTSGPPAP